MKHFLYQAVGRASTLLDGLRHSDPRRPTVSGVGRDRTGLVVQRARRLEVLHDDGEVLFVRYPSSAHSFWRAQELSLIRLYLSRLTPPVLDFGAGDGSFSSALFQHVAWGVDTDPDALAVAAQYGLYGTLVRSTNDHVPLPDGIAGSIFSNSVLEHVGDLDLVLFELARLLRPGGCFVFTVPLQRFTEHMTKWFGGKAAAAFNTEGSHRNLLVPDEWVRRLGRLGLTAETIRQYQPDWFTFWYRMLRLVGPRALGRLRGVQEATWRIFGPRLVAMVRQSITGTTDGANLFVVARKTTGR